MSSSRLPCLILSVGLVIDGFSAVKDLPFKQDVSVQYSLAQDLRDALFRKVLVDQNGIVYVLTDRGIARLFDATLAVDRSFRPLTPGKPSATPAHRGRLFDLYPGRVPSNGSAGTFLLQLPPGGHQQIAFTGHRRTLLAGKGDGC